MSGTRTLGIVSDIHLAGPAERARGNDFETRGISNPLLRGLVHLHRHQIWQRYPLDQNHLLDRFIERAGSWDGLVANGDFSCNTGFIGMSDDAALESARECLSKLRKRFEPNFRAIMGDHELGKTSIFGGFGGMKLESWRRATGELGLAPFWRWEFGTYVLMGVTSTLLAWPVYEADTSPEDTPQWDQLRAAHLAEVKRAFESLKPEQRVVLFCHDPSALPYLGREEAVRKRVFQIERTIIGHLHSNLVLSASKWLSGMPSIGFLGHTAKRMSASLRQARDWRPFKVLLCPALAGIELLNDGGYLTVEIDPEGGRNASFTFHPLPRP